MTKLLSSVLGFVLLGVALSAAGCLPEFTPYSTVVPKEMKGLNARAQAALTQRKILGDTFKVILVSDSQRDPLALDDVVEAINLRPDLHEVAFIALLGDITDMGLLVEYEWAYDAIQKSRVPFFGVIGNHDSISNGKEIYRKMFGPYDFTIDYKDVRFIAYNNNRYEFPEAPNKPWLYAAVDAAADRAHVVTMSHIPVLENATAEESAEFKAELRSRGVDHMWSGHVHRFLFDVIDGMTFLSVTKVAENALHYAVVTFSPEGVHYEACTPDCAPLN